MFQISFLSLLCVSFGISSLAAAADSGSKAAQIYMNPISFFTGNYDVGADFAMTERFILGPRVFTANSKQTSLFGPEVQYTATTVGIEGSWGLSGQKAIGQGWVLSLLAAYTPKYTATLSGTILGFPSNTYTYESSHMMGAGLVGYQWLWGSFGLKLAGGISYSTVPKTITMKDSSGNVATVDRKSSGVVPSAELLLGWFF